MVKDHPWKQHQSGMALLMVVLVLAALAAIGTPFLASMRLQESGAAKTLADHKARLAARSARDHAVSHLFDTYHSRERDFWTPGENAGDLVDDIEDLQVSFPDSLTTEPLDQTESALIVMRGDGDRILDARVTDEQGKVNINTIMTQPVWDGVNGGLVGSGGHEAAGWGALVNSRRNNQAGSVFGAIQGPTYFPTPFRSSTAGKIGRAHV